MSSNGELTLINIDKEAAYVLSHEEENWSVLICTREDFFVHTTDG